MGRTWTSSPPRRPPVQRIAYNEYGREVEVISRDEARLVSAQRRKEASEWWKRTPEPVKRLYELRRQLPKAERLDDGGREADRVLRGIEKAKADIDALESKGE